MAKAIYNDKVEMSNGTGAIEAGEVTTSGYFRRIFGEDPSLLKIKSNTVILDRWLEDHPEFVEVPRNVKNNLANIKSVLRKRLRQRTGGRRPAVEIEEVFVGPVKIVDLPTTSHGNLETLEEQIDDCLSLAKHLDREGLEDVIQLLRRARNQVVWKIGEE